MTVSVFTAIVWIFRASAPRVLVLDHVVELLDAFLDVSVLSSLPKAAANGCVRWFDRVYERTVGKRLASPLLVIEDDWLAECTLSNAMKAVVTYGHMAVVQRIHALHPQRLPVRLLPIAAAAGDLAMFQWLLTHRTDDLCIPESDRETHMVLSLESIESMSCCLESAYVEGIRHEQLHVVWWLLAMGYTPHFNLDEKAGDAAASCGDLEIVQWLYCHRTGGCTSDAMDFAAGSNHLHVVKWLHRYRTEGCSTGAMHSAATKGCLEMVMWLHEHRHEGCTAAGMQYASLSVLKFLHFHRREGFTTVVMDDAARRGDLATLEFLHHHRTEGCSSSAATSAADRGHLHIVQWLHEKYPHKFNTASVANCAREMDHAHIVRWLEAQQLISSEQ